MDWLHRWLPSGQMPVISGQNNSDVKCFVPFFLCESTKPHQYYVSYGNPVAQFQVMLHEHEYLCVVYAYNIAELKNHNHGHNFRVSLL